MSFKMFDGKEIQQENRGECLSLVAILFLARTAEDLGAGGQDDTISAEIYKGVIQDVISQVKEAFLDENVDIDVLSQLKKSTVELHSMQVIKSVHD
ncbi:hypothetical protein ANCDUO_12596 [Ancylostoma duodenale]|uniref:Uncharacterized protein n=1 Tax=Ancylostoma duodenale TaxID=51022 RepID=A0A0C2G8A6_9BILA|nr:hypothetical protein ANCDUO_12596 [Ancylostoma duodenale]